MYNIEALYSPPQETEINHFLSPLETKVSSLYTSYTCVYIYVRWPGCVCVQVYIYMCIAENLSIHRIVGWITSSNEPLNTENARERRGWWDGGVLLRLFASLTKPDFVAWPMCNIRYVYMQSDCIMIVSWWENCVARDLLLLSRVILAYWKSVRLWYLFKFKACS